MILKRRDHKVYIQCGLLWPFSIVSCLHAFATAFRLLMTFHIQIDFLNCNLLSYSRKCWKNNKNWGFLDYEQKKQLIFMFQNVPIIIYNIYKINLYKNKTISSTNFLTSSAFFISIKYIFFPVITKAWHLLMDQFSPS